MHGAVKGAVMANFGAVKGPEGAVVSGKRSREGLAGPGNPWAHIAGRLNPDLNPEAWTKPPQFI
jgi:hypothetical protein